MTSSNKTFLKLSRPGGLAISLGAIALLAGAYLVSAVNDLDRRFGRIADDREFYLSQVAETQSTLTALRDEVRSLTDKKLSVTEDVIASEAQRQSAVQQEADAVARANAARSDWDEIQPQLSKAEALIDEANQASLTLSRRRSELTALEREIKALQDETEQLQKTNDTLETNRLAEERAVRRLKEQVVSLQADVDSLGPLVQDLSAMERRVDQLEIDEDRLVARVDNLSSEESRLREVTGATRQKTKDAQDNLEEVIAELVAMRAEEDGLRVKLKSLQKLRQEADTSLTAANALLMVAKKQAEVLDASNSDKSALLTQTSQEIIVSQTELSDLKNKISSLELDANALSLELEQNKATQSKFNNLQAEFDLLVTRDDALRAELPSLEKRVEAARTEVAEEEASLTLLKGQSAGLSGRIGALDAELDLLQTRRIVAEALLAELEPRVEESKSNLQTSRADLAQVTSDKETQTSEAELLQVQIARDKEVLIALDSDISAARSTLAKLESQALILNNASSIKPTEE